MYIEKILLSVYICKSCNNAVKLQTCSTNLQYYVVFCLKPGGKVSQTSFIKEI